MLVEFKNDVIIQQITHARMEKEKQKCTTNYTCTDRKRKTEVLAHADPQIVRTALLFLHVTYCQIHFQVRQ